MFSREKSENELGEAGQLWYSVTGVPQPQLDLSMMDRRGVIGPSCWSRQIDYYSETQSKVRKRTNAFHLKLVQSFK